MTTEYKSGQVIELIEATHVLILNMLAAGWTEDSPAMNRAQKALVAITGGTADFTTKASPQPTCPIRHQSLCSANLCNEGVALVKTATLYDTDIIKSADVVDAIDNVTRVLAFWREKLTAVPPKRSKR